MLNPINNDNSTPLGEMTIEAGKTFEKIPNGIYLCTFAGASGKTIPSDDGDKQVAEFRFTVVKTVSGGDGKDRSGQTIDGIADIPATVGNKLGRWLNGLTGKPSVTAGDVVNPADHVGKRYMVVVSTNKAGNPALDTFSPKN